MEAFENIAFVFKAEMTDAFDHDRLIALVAVNSLVSWSWSQSEEIHRTHFIRCQPNGFVKLFGDSVRARFAFEKLA